MIHVSLFKPQNHLEIEIWALNWNIQSNKCGHKSINEHAISFSWYLSFSGPCEAVKLSPVRNRIQREISKSLRKWLQSGPWQTANISSFALWRAPGRMLPIVSADLAHREIICTYRLHASHAIIITGMIIWYKGHRNICDNISEESVKSSWNILEAKDRSKCKRWITLTGYFRFPSASRGTLGFLGHYQGQLNWLKGWLD